MGNMNSPISLPRMGDRVSDARVLSQAAQIRHSFSYTTFCLSYHVCPICPCGAPSPGGECYDTRIPSSKRRRSTLVAHPLPRIVIPSAAEGSLLHCRHMHTCARIQTTPWCFPFRLSLTHGLPVCKKDPSTSVGMTF